MGPTTSPTLRAHNLIQQNLASIRTRLEDVRTEAVTGRTADPARAVNGDTAKIDNLSKALAYAENRADILEFEGSRARNAQGVLGAVRDGLGDTRNAVLLSLSEPSSDETRTAAALSGLSGLEDAVTRLNAEFGGRPLFGGDSGLPPLAGTDVILSDLRALVAAAPDTDTALAQIDGYFDDPGGGFMTAIYQGGTGDAPQVEISPTERVASTVDARESALREALHGFALVALAADAPDTETETRFLEAGNDQLGGAIDRTIELQARLGVREERMATARAQYEAQATSLAMATNALIGRDQAEAATEMRLLESQLEASYLTTTRMANLSLVNYLR